MTIPWGDVSTAFHSTGIPNIRVYTGTPPKQIRRMRRLAPFLPLAGWPPLKRFLQRRVDRRAPGPAEESRQTARVYLWGEAKNAAGARVTATLETPEAYRLTAVSAVECARRAAAGRCRPAPGRPRRRSARVSWIPCRRWWRARSSPHRHPKRGLRRKRRQ